MSQKLESLTRREWLAGLASVGAAGLAASSPETLLAAGPPADLPRDLAPTSANLGSLFPAVERLAGGKYAYSFLGDRYANLETFHAEARPKVLELLAYRPAKVEPKAEVVDRYEHEDYVREKIVFSTSPDFRVPAYVYLPKKAKRPGPAIVDLHSHGGMFLFGKEKVSDLGENHPAMVEYHQKNYDGRPTATMLARRGYVVITIDAFFFGERRLLLDADLKDGFDRAKYSLDDVKRLNQQCRGKEGTLVKSLIFAGLTWPGIVFWDDTRTVDYLVTRPEVDPARIGCLGISMGGYRSLFLAALDERIRAACVVGFMSSVRPMVQAHVDTHSWVHFLPGLHQYLDWPDLVSLTAPRALLVQQCAKDGLFPPAGMKESLEKISAAYEKGKVKERMDGRFYDAPHAFTRGMQDEAFEWFDKQLKG
jgi:dienelactone hydrolase